MKLEVYNSPKPEEEVIRLKLTEHGPNVALMAVNKDGNVVLGGYLLVITLNGHIKLSRNVNADLGFELDEFGRINVL